MRSKFTGFTKVLAVCLPFALTFSLSACGDDSSSGANGDDVSGDDAGDGDEDNDRTKAYCSSNSSNCTLANSLLILEMIGRNCS